ncbi:unnamed protein product, partial [Symbiodinium microadriaticum]
VKAPTTSLFSGIRQGTADTKKKKPSVLVVKKQKVEEAAEDEAAEEGAAAEEAPAAAPEATGLGLGAYDSGSDEDESEET